MKISNSKKSMVFALSLLLSYLFAYQVIAQESGISIRFHEQDPNPTFFVDGKKIHWGQLTKEQQAKISSLREKLETAQAKLDVNQAKWDKISQQMEKKAQEIESEVAKLNKATISFDKQEINFQELADLMNELQQKVQLNEKLIHDREKELRELSKQIQPNPEAIADIDKHARALEAELTKIAASI